MGSNPKSNLSPGQVIQKCYDAPNDRIRVDAQYNATLSGDLEVAISAPDDNIAISDGTDTLGINADGSINVNVISSTPVNGEVVSEFGTASSVPSSTEITIVSYTVPGGKTGNLQRLEFGGENIAVFNLYINGNLKNKTRTFYGSLNSRMDFSSTQGYGLGLLAGDLVELKVIHNKTSIADYEGRIQVLEVS